MSTRNLAQRAAEADEHGGVVRLIILVTLLLSAGLIAAWTYAYRSSRSSHSVNHQELTRSLQTSVRQGNHSEVRELLARGLDLNARDDSGFSVLAQACL